MRNQPLYQTQPKPASWTWFQVLFTLGGIVCFVLLAVTTGVVIADLIKDNDIANAQTTALKTMTANQFALYKKMDQSATDLLARVEQAQNELIGGQGRLANLVSAASLPVNSTGYLSATTCCRYTQPDIPQLINELLAFEVRGVVNDNVFFMYLTNDWADFQTTYDDVETPYANNTYMKYLLNLTARIQNAMATNSDTMEDLMLDVFIKEIQYYTNLSAIDALFMQYGIAWWDIGWLYDPWQTAADMIPVLTGFSSRPDYASKVNQWLQSLDQKMVRWAAMAQRAVTAQKTHADVNMRLQYDLGYGPYGYFFAFTADYSPLCALMSGADQTTCNTRKASLMTKLANFLTWWNSVYRPACTANRPDSAPGLWNVPQGDQIYAILQTYHTGADQNDTYVNALGNQGVQEIFAQYDILRKQLPGKKINSVTELITALGDPNDARFTICTQDPSYVLNVTRVNLADIDAKTPALFGFQTRCTTEVIITGSASTFNQAGTFDKKKKFWDSPSQYNVGVTGTCGPTGLGKQRTKGNAPPQYLAYDLVGAKSTAAHEGKPGHALQIPLSIEIDCGFARYTSANTMFVEGWALHAEFLGNELGIYTTPVEQLGNYQSRALRDNRLREDTCLHSSESTMPAGQSRCTFQQAVQLMVSVGFSQSYAQFEAERYVIMGGQALGYRLGDIYLQQLRLQAKNAITGAGFQFDPREFYNVILRFGGGDLIRTLTPLVQTYVKFATNQTILPSDFGSDLIPSKLYSTCNPQIGLGRDDSCV